MGAERIAKVAVLNYIGLVYAPIFGITIFGEHYTAKTVLGSGRSASSERTGFQSPASLKAALQSLVVAGALLTVLYGKPNPPEVIEGMETAVA